MRKILAIAVAALVLALPAAGFAGQESVLGWMTGNWHTETGAQPDEPWRPWR